MEPLTKSECVRLSKNPNINPRTGAYIKAGSPAMQKYSQQCNKHGVSIPVGVSSVVKSGSDLIQTSPIPSPLPAPTPSSIKTQPVTSTTTSTSYRDRLVNSLQKPPSSLIPKIPSMPPPGAMSSIPSSGISEEPPETFYQEEMPPGFSNRSVYYIDQDNDIEYVWDVYPTQTETDEGAPSPYQMESNAKQSTFSPLKSPTRSSFVLYQSRPLNNRYQIIRKLGSGSYGVTFLAYDFDLEINVAIKTINRTAFGVHENIGTIEDEIGTLMELSEDIDDYVLEIYPKHIVKYIDSFTQEWEGNPTTFIVTEYIEGISLRDYRNKKGGKIKREKLISLMCQLLLGLNEIHSRGYAHRDIKPQNIMFDEKKVIRYIDFGFACVDECHYEDCHNKCRGDPGTLLYNPPENFDRNLSKNLEVAQAHDIWSLGIVFYGLANKNRYPIKAEGVGEMRKNNIKFKIKNGYIESSAYKYDFQERNIDKFINYMLTIEWQSRPKINELISYFMYNIVSPIK